jgi:hypothetical protein
MNSDNLNDVRRETSGTFRNEKGNNGLETNTLEIYVEA